LLGAVCPSAPRAEEGMIVGTATAAAAAADWRRKVRREYGEEWFMAGSVSRQ